MKPYKIGVMQGRLLPKYKGRYQAHPIGYWQDEFRIAALLGLDLIEFILDYNDAGSNPLLQPSGLRAIQEVTTLTGVAMKTVCADYFMAAPLHRAPSASSAQSREVLLSLIKNAALLGVSDIVIPCVDNSRLADEKDITMFCEAIKPAEELAERHGINLALETDLAPTPFSALLQKLDSPRITVNYDTGNSASLGYDPVEELEAYGERISDIHIKDRITGGGSVELGCGNAHFERFFQALGRTRYTGPFIMQAFRDDEGVELFKKQLAWIKPKIEAWAATRGEA